jgi:hypothetical protein
VPFGVQAERHHHLKAAPVESQTPANAGFFKQIRKIRNCGNAFAVRANHALTMIEESRRDIAVSGFRHLRADLFFAKIICARV